MTDLFARTATERERLALAAAPATRKAAALLSLVDELRRQDARRGAGTGALERVADPAGAFWIAPAGPDLPRGGIGFCDRTLRAAWARGLLAGDVERRVTLRPAAEIDAILRDLADEHERAKARARAAGRFVS